MNLSLAEVSELPLAAALLGRDGAVVARTPEWEGPGPGAATYPVRGGALVIRIAQTSPECNALIERLLRLLDGAAVEPGPAALRIRMLATSLRLVGGRVMTSVGSAADVLAYAAAGITARTGLAVHAHEASATARVAAPEVVALVLVQLAVNAERHEGAERVELIAGDSTYSVTWDGGGPGGTVRTARRRQERTRWGLGFARVAADSLGATVYPPRTEQRRRIATLELGLGRLPLPLALIRGGWIARATHGWDEETGLVPGAPARRSPRVQQLVEAAAAAPGAIVSHDGWHARRTRDRVWVAVPPDDGSARALDVLAGLRHEHALMDGAGLAARSRIAATAQLAACVLGERMPRVPMNVWHRRMRELSAVLGFAGCPPGFEGLGAIDPDVAAVLAADHGCGFEADADRLWLRITPAGRSDPGVRVLLRPGEERIPLG